VKTLSTRDKQTPQRKTKGGSVLMIEKASTLNRGPRDNTETLHSTAMNSLGMNLGTSQSSQLLTDVSRGFDDRVGSC
jgi:hypothetical protein